MRPPVSSTLQRQSDRHCVFTLYLYKFVSKSVDGIAKRRLTVTLRVVMLQPHTQPNIFYALTPLPVLLARFAMLPKMPMSWFRYVCPCVHVEQLGCQLTDMRKIAYNGLLLKRSSTQWARISSLSRLHDHTQTRHTR
jgi:hypothetical protein